MLWFECVFRMLSIIQLKPSSFPLCINFATLYVTVTWLLAPYPCDPYNWDQS